jgi:hypothetical protein
MKVKPIKTYDPKKPLPKGYTIVDNVLIYKPMPKNLRPLTARSRRKALTKKTLKVLNALEKQHDNFVAEVAKGLNNAYPF